MLALLAKGTGGFWHGGLVNNFFQGTDESTPADNDGEVIGRSNDRSPYLRNATQSSTPPKPKIYFVGGKAVARFDGSDDHWLTDLLPGSAMTFLVKRNFSAATRVSIGSSEGTTRCEFGIGSTGAVGMGVGSTSVNTFQGTTDTRNILGVAAGAFDASTQSVYWQGALENTGARAGGTNTTAALAVGASDRNGTIALPTAGDIYELVCVTGYKATDDEIAAASAYLNAA